MKKFLGILGMVGFVVCVNTSAGELVIKEQPLEWQDVAHLDGGVVFSNLCAACHGPGGKGDGPAASVLNKHVPDLTVLAANNDGHFSHRGVENAIYGKSRIVAHNTVDMPAWGEQFYYLRMGWSTFQREAFARNRVHTLTAHIESLQLD